MDKRERRRGRRGYKKVRVGRRGGGGEGKGMGLGKLEAEIGWGTLGGRGIEVEKGLGSGKI